MGSEQRPTVDAMLFSQFFHVRGLEVLQKTAETHDVDQFMGDHIEAEREQGDLRPFLQRIEDGMVLNADFVEIETGRP